MPKLIATVGLPGSGKSYWAAQQKAAVINKDDIRRQLEKKGWVWSRENEKDVITKRDDLIRQALELGWDVIAADTNLAQKHIEALKQLAKKYDAEFEIKDFTDVPIDLCIERDSKREGKANVGEKVIRDMAETYLPPEKLVTRTGEPQLFCDLDGVLADFDGFIEKEFGIVNNRDNELPNFWDIMRGYSGRLYFDMSPLPGAQDLWAGLRGYHPIILTGCPWSIASAAQDKRDWVKKYIDPDVQVVTCKSRNKSNYMKPGDILLDDWTKHRDAWVSKGGVWITFTGDVDKALQDVKEAYGR